MIEDSDRGATDDAARIFQLQVGRKPWDLSIHKVAATEAMSLGILLQLVQVSSLDRPIVSRMTVFLDPLQICLASRLPRYHGDRQWCFFGPCLMFVTQPL